ncbi:hypothetical protein O181_002758 [Austropuccinia psidii MF-1]|uniref:DNA mismatch repair protein PMS1 n=1 Tax=Austropuccinia psidii MF-1 TaxID=1389203 RepID=A0A9Q3GCX6_9BASI|nr:hypothetical protein [Austropuccinia psidii MF-1]
MSVQEVDSNVKPPPVIHALDLKSVHKITSGQVVVDLQTAIKELVENSLDAGATNIDVKFKEYGLESFSVSDDGTGIREDDLSTVGLNHHTSKLSSFEGLAQVKTFGFRGEALSSLCALAQVTIQTATTQTEPQGWALEFDKMGKMTSKKPCSRSKGTTVNVQSLFCTLPVRRKHFSKDYKKFFAQAQTLLQAYGLISTNLNLNVSNQTAKGSKTVQFQTKSNDHVKENFSNIFTPKACSLIIDLDLTLTIKPDRTALRTLGLNSDENSATTVLVKGLISRPAHGQGRNSPDRQFYYVNGRPFNPSKISKCVNEVYKQFNTNQYPVVLANFILPEDAYDVNIDPNKRTIFLHSEGNLIEALREALGSSFHPYRSTFSASQIASFSVNSSQAIGLSLLQSTPSKRKTLPLELGTQTHEEDLFSNSALPSQIQEDSEPSLIVKKPKLASASLAVDNHLGHTTSENESFLPLFRPERSPVLCDDLSASPSRPSINKALEFPEFNPDSLQVDLTQTSANSPSRPPCVTSNNIEISQPPIDSCSQLLTGDNSQPPTDDIAWVPSRLRADTVQHEARKTIQMTLDTCGASWSISKPASSRPETASKKRSISSSERMRGNLQHFMRGGAGKKALLEMNDEEDHDGELSEEEEEEGKPTKTFTAQEESRKDDSLHDAASESGDSNYKKESFVEEDSMSLSAMLPSTAILFKRPGAENPVACFSQSPQYIQRTIGKACSSEVLTTRATNVLAVPTEINSIRKCWESRKSRQALMSHKKMETQETSLQGAGLEHSEVEAEAVLSRKVQKCDFERMQVVGQFNLGFIIVRRRDQENFEDDLFIVDQHASDEKFNFEKLQRDTRLTGQRLLMPKVLNLTASEEMTAMEHLDILEFNGFGVQIDDTAKVGQRVCLVAQPVSGSTTWDISDLEELLHLIEEKGSGETVRPSKTRRMMASRACRMSTMIGDGLTTKQMARIVTQMGTMDQPWACPHGRPTMRWLTRCDENPRKVDRRYLISEWIDGKLTSF